MSTTMSTTQAIVSPKKGNEFTVFQASDAFFDKHSQLVKTGKDTSMYALSYLLSETVQRNIQPRVEYSYLTGEKSKVSQQRIFKQLKQERKLYQEKHTEFQSQQGMIQRGMKIASSVTSIQSIGTYALAAANASNPIAAIGYGVLIGIQSLNLTEKWGEVAKPVAKWLNISDSKAGQIFKHVVGNIPTFINAPEMLGKMGFTVPEFITNWIPAMPTFENPALSLFPIISTAGRYLDSKNSHAWEVYQVQTKSRMTKLQEKQRQVGEKLKTIGNTATEFKKARTSSEMAQNWLENL